MPNLFISSHPLVLHKLTKLRSNKTEPKKFRELVREISGLLAYEATADLAIRPCSVQTPLTQTDGFDLQEKIGLVPILRAGLGMVEGVWELMPSAEVWHIGIYRDEQTLKPVEYYNKLPTEPTVSVCLILDPMLATGGSAVATVDVLKRWGAKKIKFVGIIGAPEGVRKLQQVHPDVPIHLAALDDHLNEHGYIVPGLGDAGDRQFGTG
ncbi:MAG TPA: uracil phosphoribosyltransferase [Anaerolineaceae bacterium]|jgi:uracil phosphoribosyltransferase|nr:uracil phosphoribosyltransferase [Chloroflexota bacterium]HNY99923.1 uracil phosphoribosyltransferase [Anaerolineaceae bacterium]HOD44053.1 uracil phosphoribosyltransferase [Anaerolineaceae bacterium]HOH18852.1 uracil phosphoribosyltransferase [Anaerolineaceae bacterium]HOU43749.1 uracil phosphoribosyltransferase [Anaerolineaceae bacterium]